MIWLKSSYGAVSGVVKLPFETGPNRFLAFHAINSGCGFYCDFDRQAIESEREAFFLRITGPGDYRYEGADLGILITRGRVMSDDFDLNDRARDWIKGIKKLYAAKPLTEVQRDEAPAPGSFKIL